MLNYIWNPWHGCRKYSEGCANCYMFFLDKQRSGNVGEIYRVKNNFDLPLKKKRTGEYRIPSGETVYVCMTSDFFLEDADIWRTEVWEIIKKRKDLHFWLQTKRADRVMHCLPDDWGNDYSHVSICFSTENQARADERLPILLTLPFKEKNIMCAPMIGEITLSPYLSTGQIKRVLVDGENYEGSRPLHYEWVKKLYDECLEYGVLFDFSGCGNYFFKDGKTYHICKAYQRITALRSGLQIPQPTGDLSVQKKCKTCRMRHSCNGCKHCGKCR